MIKTPLFGRSGLERYRDCADAIETEVSDLIEQAAEQGWSRDEIATALINLAGELYPDMRRQDAQSKFTPAAWH